MSESYTGEIRMFAGTYAPENWHLCDGAILPIRDYEALYTLIGVTWGGDGRTSFGLPDLRGRLLVGQGAGTGLTPRVVGQHAGTETVTLTAAQMPAHSHSVVIAKIGTPPPATTNTPGPTVVPAQLTGNYVGYLPAAKQTTTGAFDNSMVQDAGGGQAHDNVMPSLALTYIICLNGIYPDKP
jgi:microcystin-dependent protein